MNETWFTEIAQNNVNAVEILITTEQIDVNQLIDGISALMFAALEGYIEIVNRLLNCDGININQQMQHGISALMLAAMGGHIEIVNRLLNCEDININQQGQNGVSALMTAALHGHIEIVRLLLNRPETDLSLTTTDNETLKDLAANDAIRVLIDEYDYCPWLK